MFCKTPFFQFDLVKNGKRRQKLPYHRAMRERTAAPSPSFPIVTIQLFAIIIIIIIAVVFTTSLIGGIFVVVPGLDPKQKRR